MKTKFMLGVLIAMAASGAVAEGPAPSNTEYTEGYFNYMVWTNDDLIVAYNVEVMGGGSCSDDGLPSPAELVIPDYCTFDGYTYPVTAVAPAGFMSLTELHFLTLPETMKWIRSSSFQGCKSLETLFIPENVWRIDNDAFMDCKTIETVTIPYNVTKISADAFRGCESMNEVINLADMTGSYHGALNGLPDNCIMYVPMEALTLATGWTNTLLPLGPYIRNVQTLASSISFELSQSNLMDAQVLSISYNGQQLAADENGVFTLSGLEPMTGYKLTFYCEVEDHKYYDSLTLTTAQGDTSAVETTPAPESLRNSFMPDGTKAPARYKGLRIQVLPDGSTRKVMN